MKKICVFMLGVFVLMFGFNYTYAVTFSDLEVSHWAYEQIMTLSNEGIINGYDNGTYKPEKSVTRGEFIKLIMTSLYGGNEYFEVNNFNFGHWATKYAIEAAKYGYLMDGTTVANLDDAISRKEMVHILAKVCIKNRIEKEVLGTVIHFSDTNALDNNSRLYIDFVTENGLIYGYTDGTFKPNKTMTRAEVATVISRFLDLKA